MFVLDTSVAVAWCFEDETSQYSEAVLEILAAGQALVPSIWPLEIVNVLVHAERQKRLTRAGVSRFLGILGGFSITIDTGGTSRAFDQILSVARDYRISAYDAAYLELAMHEGLALATLDRDLRRAALSAGLAIAAL